MSGFLYFADGITNPLTAELVSTLGLGYAFRGVPMHGPLIGGRTPSGGPGTILCEQSRMGEWEMAYRADEQVWRKRPGDDCIWVGYYKNAPPTPRLLARHKQLSGDSAILGDSQAWQVPRFWWHSGESGFVLELPRYYDLDAAGNWCYGDVDELYSDLLPIANRLLQAVYYSELDTSVEKLTTQEMLVTAPRLLSVNYVVSEIECVMLRLFKEGGNMRRLAELAVNYDRAMEWLKKKLADGTLLDSSG